MPELELLSTVALLEDLPRSGTAYCGQIGAVVELLSRSVAIVEFCNNEGRAYATRSNSTLMFSCVFTITRSNKSYEARNRAIQVQLGPFVQSLPECEMSSTPQSTFTRWSDFHRSRATQSSDRPPVRSRHRRHGRPRPAQKARTRPVASARTTNKSPTSSKAH